MHRRILVPLVVVPFGLVLLVSGPAPVSGGVPASGSHERSSRRVPDIALLVRASEVARIRAHFDSVLAELPQRDVSALTSEQQARRSALLGILRAYRDAGEFPHNYDFPGAAIPYFVDRGTGALCAVAHLVASTGRRDIVDRVAAMNNNVWVPELAGDTAFTLWLDDHGLTLAEAARIQVPYIGDEPPPPAGSLSRSSTTGSRWALGGAAAVSLWTASMNADGHSKVGNALGVLAGATAIGVGAASLGGDGDSPVIGTASVIVGATSAWLSSRGIMRQRRSLAAQRDAERATVAPILPVDGKSGAGLSVSLKF